MKARNISKDRHGMMVAVISVHVKMLKTISIDVLAGNVKCFIQ